VSRDSGPRLGDDVVVTDAVIARRPIASVTSDRVRRGAALSGGLLAVSFGTISLLLHLAYGDVWPADLNPFWRSAIVWAIAVGGPGAILAWLRPANPLGWLVCASGLALGTGQLSFSWAVVALEVPEIDLWFHPIVVWVGTWIWVPGYVLVPTLVLLLVPDGRLPSPRWRWVARFQLAAIVLGVVGFALTPWDLVKPPVTWQGLQNPFGLAGAQHVLTVSLAMVAAGAAASLVALAVRMRRGSSLERQQLKWVLLGAVLTVVMGAAAFVAPEAVAAWVAAAAVLPLVAGTVVATLRHRLWQVEAFIARSAVAAIITLLVVATYLLLVWLAGARFGAGGAQLVALVVVGLGLQPARLGVQRQVNRLLYGQRDDPYAVLAALGQRLDGAAGAEPGGEALPGVARTVATALRFPYVGIVVDDELVSNHGPRPAAVEEIPLVHAGEVVGALEVGLRRGEQHLDPDDHSLLSDISRSLAGAAHNLRLTRDLLASRQAIVTAREEERRRLHRDLHDDLGPALAALRLQLETAHDMVATDPDGARELLRRLGAHALDAVEVTRRIVTDLRPPNLDDLGLIGSLEELAARFSSNTLRVTTEIDAVGPYSAAVEVVLLRVAAEALTNTARHSGASHCRIQLRELGGSVELIIDDDGSGIAEPTPGGVGLRSMRERVAEVGGSCHVERLSTGTRVVAIAPLAP
jgi:two-component system, NarL family, sensor kinase